MAIRSVSVRALAKISGVPYGTLRKIMDLNTVADYEQITKIANALHIPAEEIIKDAEALSEDPDVIADWREENGLPTVDAATDADVAVADADNGIDIDTWANEIRAQDVIDEVSHRVDSVDEEE